MQILQLEHCPVKGKAVDPAEAVALQGGDVFHIHLGVIYEMHLHVKPHIGKPLCGGNDDVPRPVLGNGAHGVGFHPLHTAVDLHIPVVKAGNTVLVGAYPQPVAAVNAEAEHA